MGQAGTYVLVLRVEQEARIRIGRLGTFCFPSGHYFYAGSARGPGGLEARLSRHSRPAKRLRWHVDYLLREARLVEIWKALSSRHLECLWTAALLAMPGARALIPGFGSSDCHCRSHLIYFPWPPSFATFVARLQDLGAGPQPECPVLTEPGECKEVRIRPTGQA